MWQTTRDKIKFDMIREGSPESFAGKVYNLIYKTFK